jgi:cytochrome c-type biogenesis protein CcmH
LKRQLSYGLLAIVALVALGVGTFDGRDDRTIDEQVLDIAATIRCPQCSSQSSKDSDTAAARAVRAEIRERLDDGQSGDEIRDYFASRFGEELLLTPPSTGVGALVWIIPVVATVVAAVALGFAFRRWKQW